LNEDPIGENNQSMERDAQMFRMLGNYSLFFIFILLIISSTSIKIDRLFFNTSDCSQQIHGKETITPGLCQGIHAAPTSIPCETLTKCIEKNLDFALFYQCLGYNTGSPVFFSFSILNKEEIKMNYGMGNNCTANKGSILFPLNKCIPGYPDSCLKGLMYKISNEN